MGRRLSLRREPNAEGRTAGARIVRGLAALTLCVGGAVITGLATGAAPAAASNPAPLLYEIDYGGNAINVFPATATGNAAPAATVTDNANSLTGPIGSAFDAAGDLWVGNLGGTNISEFTPSQLAATGSPAPAVVISGPTSPSAVAFDAAGDLWVTTANGIDEFTPAQLTASGSPTPAVTISGVADGSIGLTFDAAGNLWVGNYNNTNSVLEYTPAQLMSIW